MPYEPYWVVMNMCSLHMFPVTYDRFSEVYKYWLIVLAVRFHTARPVEIQHQHRLYEHKCHHPQINEMHRQYHDILPDLWIQQEHQTDLYGWMNLNWLETLFCYMIS